MYSSTDAAVNAVRSNQVVAFLTDAATLQYFAQVRSQANLEHACLRSKLLRQCAVLDAFASALLDVAHHMLIKAGVLSAVASVRRHYQRAALWAQLPDVWAAQELDTVDDAQQSAVGGEAGSRLADCTGAWRRDLGPCYLHGRADGLLPGSVQWTTCLPTRVQVESNGVLDQLIRKWTTEIDQCAASAEVLSHKTPCSVLQGA